MPGRPVSEAVQQMISTAVQMEAIRRREEVRYPQSGIDSLERAFVCDAPHCLPRGWTGLPESHSNCPITLCDETQV